MKKLLVFTLFLCWFSFTNAQTFSWSGYTSGSMTYSTGIMTATVTSANPGFQNTTPRYYAAATVGSGQCGIAGGLALEHMFGNITTAHSTVTLDFTQGGATNGTCSSVTFPIKDINADESFQTFADWIEISAIDGNNNAISVANITATGGANKVITTSGNTRVIKGYGAGAYASRSSTTCDNVNISVTPPAGVPLKQIIIKYHPDYTAAPSNYYNFTGPVRPAYQYVSIGSIIATAVGGGCIVALPVDLVSFSAKRMERSAEVSWVTASEEQNAKFVLERTSDGEHYETVAVVEGKGNTQTTSVYTIADNAAPLEVTYYRLKQIDLDGNPTYYDLAAISAVNSDKLLDEVHPNPASNVLVFSINLNGEQQVAVEVIDQLGRKVYCGSGIVRKGSSMQTLDISGLENGGYILRVTSENGSTEFSRFIKED